VRLAPHEEALAGFQLRGGTSYGSFGARGTWIPSPARATEQDFAQDVFTAARVFQRLQLAALVPMVETRREMAGLAELGGGLGDVTFSGRWDVVLPARWPGVAALFGVTLPTGTPPELSKHTLATDVTGLGVVQGSAGIAFEHFTGPWLFDASSVVTVRAPYASGPVREALAPQVTSSVAATYVFHSGAALALLLTYAFEGDATIDGATVPNSGRREPRCTFAFVMPFFERWRAQAMLFAHPPLLGQNVVASLGAGVTLTRTWW
jgi:hypothetical protein